MSQKHPIVAVTGSSGAGTSTVKKAFEHIFFREKINPLVVEGDSFHAFDRAAMKEEMAKHEAEGNRFFSHFGENANEFGKLEELFASYGKNGTGQKRYYLHSEPEAVEHNARLGIDKTPGQFTPWEDIETGSDLMFYEGLHGLVPGLRADHADHALDGRTEGLHARTRAHRRQTARRHGRRLGIPDHGWRRESGRDRR